MEEALRLKSKEDLVHVSVYLPKSLHKKIEELSTSDRRSLSAEIVVLLEKSLTDKLDSKKS